ncbi:hypothetical protein ACT17S_16225 [Glutamicibacter mysorens]
MGLITAADLEAYQIPENIDTSSPLAGMLIESASDEVIDAAGSPILSTRSVVDLPALRARILRLPGLPVTAVHAVSIAGTPVADWQRINTGLYRASGWSEGSLEIVTVDYTHGLPALPADIKDIVCRMVISGLLNASEGADGFALDNGRLSSVSIDDYKESYATGDTVDAITEMSLPQRTRERLAKRFGNYGAKVVGSL